MKYSFSEKNLGTDFCEPVVKQLREVIKAGSSCTVIGMPYIGLVPFFRYVAMTDISYFVLIDVHALQSPTKEALFFSLYKELGGTDPLVNSHNILEKCKEKLHVLLQKEEKVVILINQINYLKKELSNGLLLNLRTLEDCVKGKIFFIISATKPLHEYYEVSNYEKSIGFASKIIYFPPYSKADLEKRVSIYPLDLQNKQKNLTHTIKLSGGNSTLFHILLKTNYFDDPFVDKQILFHLEQIYEDYSTQQKSQIKKIATGKKVNDLDPFLINVGLVKKVEERYELFSPLFRDYVQSFVQSKLPKKERKLLSLLKKNLGKIVSKDEIFEAIWPDDENVSEASLTSLLYRLRKNPTFLNKGYVIENEKEEGYRMIKD